MRRRTVLAAVGVGLAATAGCLARPGDPSAGASDDTPSTTDGPGDDEQCPSFSDDAARTVCARGPGDADVYPTVSERVFAPTTGDGRVETVRFVLHNESGGEFGLNPYAWGIERRTADGWTHVAPDAHVEPWTTIADGETYTWELSVESHPSPMAPRTRTLVEDLDTGSYAFHVTGSVGEDATVEFVAQFEVERE